MFLGRVFELVLVLLRPDRRNHDVTVPRALAEPHLGGRTVRTGPPIDEDDDYAYPMWAGVLPVTTTVGEPIADPKLTEGIELPDNVKALVGREL